MRFLQSVRKACVPGPRDKRLLFVAALVYFIGATILWFWLPPAARLRWQTADKVRLLAYLPDGHTLLGDSDDLESGLSTGRGPIRFWDARTGEHTGSILSEAEYLNANSFGISADGRFLVWHDMRHLHVIDLATRQEIATLASPHGQVSISPDGKALAYTSGERDNYDSIAVEVWDIATQQERFRLERASWRASWSRDGKMLATGTPFSSKESPLRENVDLWDAKTGQHLATLSDFDAAAGYLRFSADGQILAADCYFDGFKTGYLQGIKLWDVASHRWIATIECMGNGMALHTGGHVMAFIPVRHVLVTRDYDRARQHGSLRYWDATTGHRVKTIGLGYEAYDTHRGGPEVTADGKWLMVHSRFDESLRLSTTSFQGRNEIMVYNGGSGQHEATIPTGDWPGIFAPDGMSLATAMGNEIIIYDLPPHKRLAAVFGWPLLGVLLLILLGQWFLRRRVGDAGAVLSEPAA